MMKFEIINANGKATGNIELDLAHVTKVERGKYGGRDVLSFEGGWIYVDLSADQLAAIYRVMAEQLEREANEQNEAAHAIR